MTQPISMIAKSLVRERQRTGLSLAEIARRAGIAKSTLSQLEAEMVILAWKRCGRCVWRWISPLPDYWNRRSKNAGDSPWRRDKSRG